MFRERHAGRGDPVPPQNPVRTDQQPLATHSDGGGPRWGGRAIVASGERAGGVPLASSGDPCRATGATVVVVIGEELAQEPSQVRLVQHDHVIQQVTLTGSHPALGDALLSCSLRTSAGAESAANRRRKSLVARTKTGFAADPDIAWVGTS